MKKRDFLFVLISGFILVVIWIGFNIYHNAVTSTIPEATSIQIEPIAPTFDMQSIASIKKREKASPVFELSTNQTQSGSTATQSASTQSNQATSSGALSP
ncbi:MAG: hypothetical protein HYV39_03420 [Candidatus Levybacteria bacterium]|nr:hypothetical protein [Candidatus Levybacteria bacterium]